VAASDCTHNLDSFFNEEKWSRVRGQKNARWNSSSYCIRQPNLPDCVLLSGARAFLELTLCFHRAEILFIASIDFCFQIFFNRCKKNNQLDTLF